MIHDTQIDIKNVQIKVSKKLLQVQQMTASNQEFNLT